MITVFGTCRNDRLPSNNHLCNRISFTHSTKEVIQMIEFVKGDLVIPFPYSRYCFRTGIRDEREVQWDPVYPTLINKSQVVVVEICSRKTYVHKDHNRSWYLHHLCADERFRYTHRTPMHFLSEVKMELQSDDEIENDICEIVNLLPQKRVVFVTHYNAKLNGKVIPARDRLIDLVKDICTRKGWNCVDPTEALSMYSQEDVMTSDLGHYTPLGEKLWLDWLDKYISKMMANEDNKNGM